MYFTVSELGLAVRSAIVMNGVAFIKHATRPLDNASAKLVVT